VWHRGLDGGMGEVFEHLRNVREPGAGVSRRFNVEKKNPSKGSCMVTTFTAARNRDRCLPCVGGGDGVFVPALFRAFRARF
jgi:hypothetical protein